MKPIGYALAVCAIIAALPDSAGAAPADDPLTRPIIGSRAAEWVVPRAPEALFGRTYLVGPGTLNVALIDTGAGLVLIDGALPQAAATILANVRTLGFNPKDIKFILSTEPHFDHAGGLAALARDTGATIVASPRGAAGLRSGRLAADDPQLAYGGQFPAVARVRAIQGGDTLRLGDTVITAIATPGHTMGSMSWRWQACAARDCRTVVFASSLNPVSAGAYRYSATTSAPIVAGFRASYRRMATTPCDILIAAHVENGDPPARADQRPGACHAYAERSRQRLDARLAEEAGAVKP